MADLSIAISSIVALVLGILVLIFPKFLRVLVGLYLIIVGLVGIVF